MVAVDIHKLKKRVIKQFDQYLTGQEYMFNNRKDNLKDIAQTIRVIKLLEDSCVSDEKKVAIAYKFY